jgi:hypothetical protein
MLFLTLRRAKSTAWRFVSTGDESWFLYYTPRRKLWIPPDVEAPEMARQLSATPKLMITIFWGVSGIHVIDYLPRGTSFDSTYFSDYILCGFNSLPIILVTVKQKKRL